MSSDPQTSAAGSTSEARLGARPLRQLYMEAQLPPAVRSSGKPCAVPVNNLAPRSAWLAETIYRVFEILVALSVLVLGLPLIVIAAMLIRWDSPGPALFLHKRPGRSIVTRGRDLEGRTDLTPPPGGYDPDACYYVPSYFTLPKLRTMRSDARLHFPGLYSYQFAPGEFHKQFPTLRDDPRVTRVGRILRTLSVDELPNLWCVLLGDIRLVGPRPEAPEVLQYYTPDEMYKFVVRPGITGLAQISGRGLLNWGETIACDLQYVRSRSVMLDLKILLITLKRVLTRRGAF